MHVLNATFQLSSAALNLGQSQNGLLGNGFSSGPYQTVQCFNLSPHKAWYLHVYNVFCPFDVKSYNLKQILLFVYKALNLDKSKISCVVKSKNMAGKGEDAGYQHFLSFLQCSEKTFHQNYSWHCAVKGKYI